MRGYLKKGEMGRRFVVSLFVMLVFCSAASANEKCDDLSNLPSKLADEMLSGDLCRFPLTATYAHWFERCVIIQEGNTTITKKDKIIEHELDGTNQKCRVRGNLGLYALDLAWGGAGLRSMESAVLKRCRSFPRKALENQGANRLCSSKNYQELAEQRLGQVKGANLGPAARRFLDLLAQSKGGTAISQGVMAEAYWAAVDEFNNSDVRAEIEAARKQQEQ